jgi:hypothetical protein
MEDEEKKPKSPTYHRPEFVIIDDDRFEQGHEGEASQEGGSFYESLNKLHEVKPTFSIRIACLISSVLLFMYTAFIGVLMLIAFALMVVTFGYFKNVVKGFVNFWNLFIKLFVISMGLFVGFFSPTFGLGIIILFFVLQGDREDPLLSRIIKSRFYSEGDTK